MKTTTIFLCLIALFVQTSTMSAQTGRLKVAQEEQLLKLDSIIISDFTRYEYSYNQQGQLTSEKYFVATDSVNMIYDLMQLTEHNYENGKKMSSVNSYGFGGVLTLSNRKVLEYADEKLSTERLEYYYNNQWNSAKKSDYLYREDGLLSKIEYSVLINGNYSMTEKADYTYDEQSKQLLNIVNKVLMSENLWSDKTKTKFDYNAGNLIAQTEFNWNDTINDWKASVKKEFIYDETNSNKVIYKESYFAGDAFVTTLEKEFTLDNACPTANLVLPYETNLPFKVKEENIVSSQKSSQYYYSLLVGTGVNNVSHPVTMSIYPNPAKDILNVQSDQRINAVEIFNVLGKLSASCVSSFDKVDISGLTKGVYFVKINSTGGYTTLKLIKR